MWIQPLKQLSLLTIQVRFDSLWCDFCSICCLTGVTVLFESVALTVAENDSFVEACVVLLHTNLQQSFAIDLVPQSGTATSKSYYSAVLYGFENRE